MLVSYDYSTSTIQTALFILNAKYKTYQTKKCLLKTIQSHITKYFANIYKIYGNCKHSTSPAISNVKNISQNCAILSSMYSKSKNYVERPHIKSTRCKNMAKKYN